jgi:NADH-quinone oxidoreductase subunit J
MTWPFAITALLTLASAVAAMSLRNLVHCVLMLMVTFAGLAAFYLQLDAQFIGFAQILVYIGAVAILLVFAILLTRANEPPRQSVFSATWVVGIAVAVTVFGLLSAMILSSRAVTREIRPAPEVTVRQIGEQLMNRYVLPLEVIGAVIIAMHEKEGK